MNWWAAYSAAVLSFALSLAHAQDGMPQTTVATKDRATQDGVAPLSESRSGPPGSDARGIEKKDIRRGMVIAKPDSITPHTRTTSNEGSGGAGDVRR